MRSELRKVKRTKDRRGVLMYIKKEDMELMKNMSNVEIARFIIQYLQESLERMTEEDMVNNNPVAYTHRPRPPRERNRYGQFIKEGEE